MSKCSQLYLDMQELNCRVKYHAYLENNNNPLKSYEDFAEDYYTDLLREEDRADEHFQASQFGAGA